MSISVLLGIVGEGMHFIRRINDCLEVIQVGDVIEQGVTMPLRCRLHGGIEAIVKYQRNPGGLEVLIDEWIGNSIADLIGLTIPRYGLCNLSVNVIDKTNNNYEIDSENAGIAFFSEYLNNTVPVDHKRLVQSQNKETEKLLLFDHLIKNEDRHDGNLICKVGRPSVIYYIDCSHFMAVDGHYLNRDLDLDKELSPEEILSTEILKNKNRNIYNTLCETQCFDEIKLFHESKRIKQLISDELLDNIKDTIPAEWSIPRTKRRIDNIFTIIRKRLSMIDDITEMIAEERRRE